MKSCVPLIGRVVPGVVRRVDPKVTSRTGTVELGLNRPIAGVVT